MEKLAEAFRSKKEAKECYEKFDQTVCVSEFVKKDFSEVLNFQKACKVLYNKKAAVVKQKLISLVLTTAAQLANLTDAELMLAGRFYYVRVDIRFCIQ